MQGERKHQEWIKEKEERKKEAERKKEEQDDARAELLRRQEEVTMATYNYCYLRIAVSVVLLEP